MGMKPRTAAKRRAREGALIEELQKEHGYILWDVARKADRYETVFNMTTGRSREMRVIRLCVPEHSALGRAFAKRDQDQAKTGRKRR